MEKINENTGRNSINQEKNLLAIRVRPRFCITYIMPIQIEEVQRRPYTDRWGKYNIHQAGRREQSIKINK